MRFLVSALLLLALSDHAFGKYDNSFNYKAHTKRMHLNDSDFLFKVNIECAITPTGPSTVLQVPNSSRRISMLGCAPI